MDHTPFEDEFSWWFDFRADQHQDLVTAVPCPGKSYYVYSARGPLLEWLNQYPASLWEYADITNVRKLTIMTRDPDFAFAFRLRWS